MGDRLKILVIPNDPICQYKAKGLDPILMSRYFNPEGMAVRILDVHGEGKLEWDGFGPSFLETCKDSALLAWIGAASHGGPKDFMPPDALLQGFPGFPRDWLDAIRAYAPNLIRGYNGGWCGFLAGELGRLLPAASVASVHDLRGVEAVSVKRVSAVVAVSNAVADRCVLVGARPEAVVVISDRVQISTFTESGPVVSGAPKGAPKLLCIARDSPEKNLDRLLTACARARAKHPDLVLVHIGRSSRDWSVWSFVTHFEAIPNSELPTWYRWADWFVLPSLSEGFGIVFAESLACGTPCLTSDRAPMNEIVRNGICGLTCNPESVDSITSVIERAIADPGLRTKLAGNARAASEPYDIERVEKREAALYRWLTATNPPSVSVVLPTFNRAKLIEAAIRNVLAQDYANLELVVVNDGSKDDTASVLERLKGELKDDRLHIVTKKNEGLPRALNRGFTFARGDYFTWTSDDNAYRPGAISAMVRELELDTEAVLVFADYQVFDSQGTARNIVHAGPIEDLSRRNVIGACFLYRRHLAQQAGEYDPVVELAEDYDYWLRLSRLGRFVHLPRVLYDYGDTPDSLSRQRTLEVGEAAARVLSRHANNAQSKSALRDHLVVLAGEFKQRGLPMRSFSTALSLIARFPLSKSGYWAAARALTPRTLLNATRKLRGLDGR